MRSLTLSLNIVISLSQGCHYPLRMLRRGPGCHHFIPGTWHSAWQGTDDQIISGKWIGESMMFGWLDRWTHKLRKHWVSKSDRVVSCYFLILPQSFSKCAFVQGKPLWSAWKWINGICLMGEMKMILVIHAKPIAESIVWTHFHHRRYFYIFLQGLGLPTHFYSFQLFVSPSLWESQINLDNWLEITLALSNLSSSLRPSPCFLSLSLSIVTV